MENSLNNQQGGGSFLKPDVPNNIGILVVGIVSLVLLTIFSCLGFGFFGLIASIIGFVLAIKAQKVIEANPDMYSEKSMKNVKIGKILNLIALIIGVVATIAGIVILVIGGAAEIMNSY